MNQKTKYVTKILVVPLVLLLLLVLVGNFAASLAKLKDTYSPVLFAPPEERPAADKIEPGKTVPHYNSPFSYRTSPTTESASAQEAFKILGLEEIEALARAYRHPMTAVQNISGHQVRRINLKPNPFTPQATGENRGGISAEAQRALNEGFPAFLRAVLHKGETAQTNKISDEMNIENPFTKAIQRTAEEMAAKETLAASSGQDRQLVAVRGLTGRASIPSPPVFRFFGDIDHSHRVRMVEGNLIAEGTFGLIGYGVGAFDLAVNPRQLPFKQSVTVGDINNDRIMDLVVAERSSNLIRVFLGIGDNQYREISSLRVGLGVLSVNLGDFNNDGNLDLVVASTGINNIAILLGDGTGAFTYFTDFRGPDHSTAILVDDLNGDGVSDLMLLDLSARAFKTFVGDGTGNFSPTDLNPASLASLSIPAPNINLDGRNDAIELLQLGHSVSINTNNRQGEIQNIINYTNFPNFFTVLGDFSNDGHMDLAIGILINLTKG